MRAGLRPVVLWLPNTSDHDYRARIADQCRRLAELTADEETMAVAFEKEATQTPGWR
jgi:Antitoxin MazE-like